MLTSGCGATVGCGEEHPGSVVVASAGMAQRQTRVTCEVGHLISVLRVPGDEGPPRAK